MSHAFDTLQPTCNGECPADEPHRAPCPLALDTLPPLEPALMPTTIYARAARFRAELAAAYAAHPELPPGVLEAIGDRETLWGWAPEYRLADGTQAQVRPDGTGDWEPREINSAARAVRLAPFVYHLGGGRVMPLDGQGWGRGLMQADFEANHDFCARACPGGDGHTPACTWAWACARCNILRAAEELAEYVRLSGGYLFEVACAYNAGWGAVLRARTEAGVCGSAPVEQLDKHTTGGDYASDVERRRLDFLRETGQLGAGPEVGRTRGLPTMPSNSKPPAAPAEEK